METARQWGKTLALILAASTAGVVTSSCGDNASESADAQGTDLQADVEVADATTGDDAAKIPRRPTDLTRCAISSAQQLADLEKLSDSPTDARLTELSGLVASRKNADVLWMHDDSGNEPNLYAINTEGQPLAIYRLAGVALRDWEDIAIGPGPNPSTDYLYIGDIGDKNRDGLGSDIVVYRLPEPRVSSTAPDEVPQQEVTAFEPLLANYPEGLTENADALFVDPNTANRNPDIYVITSGNGITTPNRVFRLSNAAASVAVTMEYLLDVFGGDSGDPEVTGADISANGRRIIFRSLTSANLWERSGGASIAEALAEQPCAATIPAADAATEEGGAVGFSASGDGYFTTLEDDPPPLFFVLFGS